MDINEFKKLKSALIEQDFNKEYKNINTVMFSLSIFGHISSIFLAYFLLSKILSNTISNNPILVFVSSIIMLTGLELLKRDIFQKFSTQVIKSKKFIIRNVYPLLISALLLVSVSFYATISGAKEFSSKEKEIETVAENISKKYTDSLTNVYNTKIVDIEKDSKDIKSKIESKDQEQTDIESSPVNPQKRNRISDLKKEKDVLRADLSKCDTNINKLKRELDTRVNEYEFKTTKVSSKKKDENKSNSLLFIIISTMIEFVILAGVYFNRFYLIRSYTEFKDKIDKDPNYHKWALYDSLLDIVYNEDTKVNDRFPGSKTVFELARLNGINIIPKDAIDFIKMLSSLNILRVNGTFRYFGKSREAAKEVIKKHFNM